MISGRGFDSPRLHHPYSSGTLSGTVPPTSPRGHTLPHTGLWGNDLRLSAIRPNGTAIGPSAPILEPKTADFGSLSPSRRDVDHLVPFWGSVNWQEFTETAIRRSSIPACYRKTSLVQKTPQTSRFEMS